MTGIARRFQDGMLELVVFICMMLLKFVRKWLLIEQLTSSKYSFIVNVKRSGTVIS